MRVTSAKQTQIRTMKSEALPILVALFTFALAQEIPLPDPAGCIASECITHAQIRTLWCHTQPTFYCQCVPLDLIVWEVMVRPCAPGTYFSFPHQKCVYPEMRDPDACYPDGSGSGSGDDSFILCDEPPCRVEKDSLKGVDAPEVIDDQLLEDDAMEFLFPGRRV
ncbi:uncharacterized protein LOC131693034 [Topomyia yanbarensis]|uniref:uncharacterized protein LOC131693034 n=1 Tax=Topomyia yanbarensis TaxID=2498891 RepID=UPI00273B3F19|nr:uncharacterized protein LOC131693034 [Topomyia yanbarensis]